MRHGWRHPQPPSASQAWLHAVLGVLAVVALMVVLLLGWMIATARGQDATQQYLLSWILKDCCVTNRCCWQISGRELVSLPGDMWRVRSTGQVLKRTDYSPDGRYYRCACDHDKTTLQWIRHQGAHTRCIFVPMRSVRR